MAAIHYNAQVPAHYVLHAFAVMPNHFHPLLTPKVPLPNLTKSLKGTTAERVNAMLARTGSPFRQEESDGREVRQEREFERIRFYIESNPVRPVWARCSAQSRSRGSRAIKASAQTVANNP